MMTRRNLGLGAVGAAAAAGIAKVLGGSTEAAPRAKAIPLALKEEEW